MPIKKEALERLLYTIITKKEPKLVDKVKVQWGGRAHYQISRNGTGTLLKVGLLPGDSRLNPVLTKATVELLQMVEGRAFSMPSPTMSPDERRGWDELVKLGARPFTHDPHSLDIRVVPLRQRGKLRMDIPRFAAALVLVVGRKPDAANHWLEDGSGTRIGVYTKERK